jgi:DNA-binding protein
VTQKGEVHRYFKYAKYLLTGEEPKESRVTIKAMGKAVVNAVKLVEIIKNIIGHLHQYNKIETTEIEEKNREGVIATKKITTFVTVLSMTPFESYTSYKDHVGKLVQPDECVSY